MRKIERSIGPECAVQPRNARIGALDLCGGRTGSAPRSGPKCPPLLGTRFFRWEDRSCGPIYCSTCSVKEDSPGRKCGPRKQGSEERELRETRRRKVEWVAQRVTASPMRRGAQAARTPAGSQRPQREYARNPMRPREFQGAAVRNAGCTQLATGREARRRIANPCTEPSHGSDGRGPQRLPYNARGAALSQATCQE